VLEWTLDNHAIALDAIQLSVPAMRPDLLKPKPTQERPACCVFRKYSAYELVQTPATGGLDEGGKHPISDALVIDFRNRDGIRYRRRARA
jgi:hypothetical protein